MSELNKSLSVVRGTGLMLNIVIGAGLLALPGLAFKTAGDHALWAWVVCAVAALPLIWVLIIIGKRFPNAGGIAHFAAQSYGGPAYIMTSLIFLGAVFLGVPAIALTGGYYMASLLPINPTLAAALLVVVAGSLHLISSEAAGRISTSIASLILLCLLAVAAIGLYAVEWQSVGHSTANIADLQAARLLLPFMMIFFAFTGWEVAANLSEEFKNPRRDFPIAMLLSFAVATALYFIMAFVVQNVPIGDHYESSFVPIIGIVFGTLGEAVIAVLAAVIIFANLIGVIWVISRQIFSLSRENYLPFKITANKQGVPVIAVLMAMAGLLTTLGLHGAGLLALENLLELAGRNLFILCAVACLALFKLSHSAFEKIVALGTMVMVGAIMWLEGGLPLYPMALSLVGILLWRLQRRHSGA